MQTEIQRPQKTLPQPLEDRLNAKIDAWFEYMCKDIPEEERGQEKIALDISKMVAYCVLETLHESNP